MVNPILDQFGLPAAHPLRRFCSQAYVDTGIKGTACGSLHQRRFWNFKYLGDFSIGDLKIVWKLVNDRHRRTDHRGAKAGRTTLSENMVLRKQQIALRKALSRQAKRHNFFSSLNWKCLAMAAHFDGRRFLFSALEANSFQFRSSGSTSSRF